MDARRSGSRWTKSSFCANACCVEVAIGEDVVQVRDSKNPDENVLAFTREEWKSFIKGAQHGEFSL
jgi:uncharacterized protein DUF397